MKLYKLTDDKHRTWGDTLWSEGTTHAALGPSDGPLCTSSWIHAYEDPRTAALLNAIHGEFTSPVLWEAEGEIGIRDYPLKCGCRKLTTLSQLPLPVITAIQRMRIAIACAWPQVADNRCDLAYPIHTTAVPSVWIKWARAWLDYIAGADVPAPDMVGYGLVHAGWWALTATHASRRGDDCAHHVARAVQSGVSYLPGCDYYACLDWGLGTDPIDKLIGSDRDAGVTSLLLKGSA